MDELKLKSFKYWKTQEIRKTFGVTRLKESEALNEWLDVSLEVAEEDKRQLDKLQKRLIEKVQYWNEATLAFHFITPLLNMVDFNSENYQSFLETKLQLNHGAQIIKGNVDFLVATGEQIPDAPFFTLHEYKPEPNISTDPQGQLLVALLAAQQENAAKGIDIPLYGTYIMGRLFFFVYFHQNHFTTSLAYDATKDDLYRIFNILKKTKRYIDQQVEQLQAATLLSD